MKEPAFDNNERAPERERDREREREREKMRITLDT
jgi:hypothetical protein